MLTWRANSENKVLPYTVTVNVTVTVTVTVSGWTISNYCNLNWPESKTHLSPHKYNTFKVQGYTAHSG
jgi:hypothetical protein